MLRIDIAQDKARQFGLSSEDVAHVMNSIVSGAAVSQVKDNLGGYIGPFVIGALKEYTGNLASGLYFLSGVMLFGLFLTFVVYRTLERKHVLQSSEFAASARAATHL